MNAPTSPPTSPGRGIRIARCLLRACLYLVILAQLALLLPLCAPPIGRQNEAERQLASVHLKQIGEQLERFRAEFGSYPCDATAELLAARHPELSVEHLRGDYSNNYLRQLFYMAKPADERHFYAKLRGFARKGSTHEGDNQLQQKALEMGENAMGYILRRGELGQRESVQAGGAPTPLLICALYPNNTPYAAHKLWLDHYSFRGHVLVLYTDGSVRDHQDDCEEDDIDDSLSRPKRSLFPTLPDGSDSARQHIALPPLLTIE